MTTQFAEVPVGLKLASTPQEAAIQALGLGARNYTVVQGGSGLNAQMREHLIGQYQFAAADLDSIGKMEDRPLLIMALKSGDTVRSAGAAAIELLNNAPTELQVVFKHTGCSNLFTVNSTMAPQDVEAQAIFYTQP